jgi:nucleotide-binding universal stress UspA family protein
MTLRQQVALERAARRREVKAHRQHLLDCIRIVLQQAYEAVPRQAAFWRTNHARMLAVSQVMKRLAKKKVIGPESEVYEGAKIVAFLINPFDTEAVLMKVSR